ASAHAVKTSQQRHRLLLAAMPIFQLDASVSSNPDDPESECLSTDGRLPAQLHLKRWRRRRKVEAEVRTPRIHYDIHFVITQPGGEQLAHYRLKQTSELRRSDEIVAVVIDICGPA